MPIPRRASAAREERPTARRQLKIIGMLTVGSEVGIPLGRVDALVAQEFLDSAETHARDCQPTSVGVPEEVRRQALGRRILLKPRRNHEVLKRRANVAPGLHPGR
jgi:hypothetical protein